MNAHYERSDVCVVPAAGVIGESMVAACLADAMLEKFGGDHIEETLRNYRSYLATTGPRGQATATPTSGGVVYTVSPRRPVSMGFPS